ncbi:MAG: MIP family channel protein [Desulfovibrio sp.]|mgnify:CR=1 FL=1|nr:MAG: MIP family channel protein [Desulfovibrio sp.]
MNTWIAEILGTFFLVFVGTGAIITDQMTGGTVTHLGVALSFGLVVMAMIYAVGNISGAHLNPAVTLGFVAAGRMKLRQAPAYMLCQFLGAVLASGLLFLLFPDQADYGMTLPSGTWGQAFGFEVVLTFMLMFVILNVSTGDMVKGIMAGVAIGGTVAMAALFAGPICGASMNPARSLGPALVSGHFEHLWIYLSAPFVGASAAMCTCRLIQGPECCPSNNGACSTNGPKAAEMKDA